MICYIYMLQSGKVLETPSSPKRDSFKPVDSAAVSPEVNCIPLVCDDFLIIKRTFRAQHLPKSGDLIKNESSPSTLQVWAKSSHKAVSKYEVYELWRQFREIGR